MNRKFYNCSYDLVFKMVFSDEKSIPLLKELIKEVTGIEALKISYLSGNVLNESIYSKDRYVDLVVDTGSEVINIELNNSNYLDRQSLTNRNLSYIASFYTNNIKNNSNYIGMSKFIQINFTFNKKSSKKSSVFVLRDNDGEVFSNILEIYEINMSEILKEYRKNGIMNLEKFRYSLLLGLTKEELEYYCKGNDNMEEFNGKVKDLNRKDDFVQFLTVEEDETKKINTGMILAERKGIEKGIEKTKKESAINLYNNGVSIELISMSLNMSIDEVKNIIKNS